MTNNIDLYWFSGTGNTLYIAMQTKKELEELGFSCSLIPIEKKPKVKPLNSLGIIVPVAAQGTYPNVWEFLDRLPKAEGTEIFLIDTMAKYSGGIKGPIKKVVKKKGYLPIGAIEIIMPTTFLKKEINQEEDKNKKDQIIKKAKDSVKHFCKQLQENKGQWKDIPIYSDFMGSFFRTRKSASKWIKLFPKTRNERCTECGICAKICPEGCIIENQKYIVLDSEKCILCQRCMEYCPENALSLGKKDYIRNNRISLKKLLLAIHNY